MKNYYDWYIHDEGVRQNQFLQMERTEQDLPTFAESVTKLPQPFWAGNDHVIEAYWKAWELAFGHLRKANEQNGFVANYIDTAFNNDLFMYDSTFILMFANYGRYAFDFQRTLDNFYAKQHPDGFICRQIRQTDGTDVFHRYDPSSTGPNVMPWVEWEYYQMTNDRERLERVFHPLVAYHRWLKAHRTWPDGSYWANGWSGAADNLPRVPGNTNKERDYFHHGHLIWADACLFQLFAGKLLIAMAEELGHKAAISDIADEIRHLARYVNEQLWDEETAYYYDKLPSGELTGVRNIGAYWALIAGAVPSERLVRFVGHLDDPRAFNRPHRVPSLAADHPAYAPEGDYWVGAVWAPTNYMVMRGLQEHGYEELSAEIARNHLDQVVRVFQDTGTLWENYSPERCEPGKPAKPDFVGWGGLPPIAVLFESVFGLRADVPNGRLIWHVTLLEEHGISQYPFGRDGLLDLKCEARTTLDDRPQIEVRSNVAFELVVVWQGGKSQLQIEGGGASEWL